MEKTYCGKECENCEWKVALKCPGCKSGPGKYMYGDCELADCCCQKDYAGCFECEKKENCSLLAGCEKEPEMRRERMISRKTQNAERENSKFRLLKSWIWILLLLRMVPLGLYGIALLAGKRRDKRFGLAGICYYLAPILGFFSLFFVLCMEYRGAYFRHIFLFLPFILLGNVSKYNECKGLAGIMVKRKWREFCSKLWIGWLIANIIFMLGFLGDISRKWQVIFKIIGFNALGMMNLCEIVILVVILVELNRVIKTNV